MTSKLETIDMQVLAINGKKYMFGSYVGPACQGTLYRLEIRPEHDSAAQVPVPKASAEFKRVIRALDAARAAA
jgi:hypothetical protein